MTKSQNTKNEQQKDLCITSEQLTEELKKGELPEGEYWVKYIYGDIERLEYCWKTFNDNGYPINNETIEQVLAPVPTYEEWQASEKYNKHLEEVIKVYERKDKQATETSIAYSELLEENARLKSEYEKECKRADELEDSYWKEVEKNKKLKELLKEIIADADLSYCDSDIELRIDEVLK